MSLVLLLVLLPVIATYSIVSSFTHAHNKISFAYAARNKSCKPSAMVISCNSNGSINNENVSAFASIPGNNDMSIDELKAELTIRNVDYSDCFTKNELKQKLLECRVVGKADPNILTQFNTLSQQQDNNQEDIDNGMKYVYMSSITAKDGSLPGGLSPEMLKKLVDSPEILQMLKDPKLQQMMSVSIYLHSL